MIQTIFIEIILVPIIGLESFNGHGLRSFIYIYDIRNIYEIYDGGDRGKQF